MEGGLRAAGSRGRSRISALAARAVIDVSDGVVRVDGHDVKSAIRTPEIDRAAAAVARQPGVREVLIASSARWVFGAGS